MKNSAILKKLLVTASVFVIFWIGLLIFSFSSPVVFLHYSATASEPVDYFFNDNHDIVKDRIHPGASLEFRIPHNPSSDYYINVSIPSASRDGVDVKPPFSRVDVYIGADTSIERVVIRTDYMARVGYK